MFTITTNLQAVKQSFILEKKTGLYTVSALGCHATWAGPEGGELVRTPLPPHAENHKNIGYLCNTGPDPLKNHKATKPAFNVRPSSACQRSAI